MRKEAMLKRAFNQIISSDAVKFIDKETDLLIIRNYIVQYAKKNDVSIALDEIETFVQRQHKKIDDSLKDLACQVKMMR